MLQSVRDNLKGTVVTVVIVLFFILPMVITGVGSSFLGSVAGTDAAVVDGKTISKTELNREVYLQKQRLLSQSGVDPSADFLKDENLAKPVLDRLTKKAAILAAAENGGMAVSENAINSVIVSQAEFQQDGKFDAQVYRSMLARIGMTPASYKASLGQDLMLSQLNAGLELSSFVTEQEADDLLAIIHEKRTFLSVDIPSDGIAETLTVSDDEIETYYHENQSEFLSPEQMSIEYVETSVRAIAETLTASEDEVRAQYEQEAASFDSTAEYEIAHILLEGDGQETSQSLADIQQKIAAGEDFAALARQYSADAGSAEQGGNLGVIVPGVFPEAFEQAVQGLEAGEVSGPVVSDSGTHLLKVLSKSVPEVPTFEDREADIANNLKLAKAEEVYLANLEQLEELSFSAPDLAAAANELGLEVKTSQMFERTRGIGIAGNAEVRKAAFESDVLVDGHNSRVIELAGNRAIVIRKAEHSPEHTKTLEEVKADINDKLVALKVEAVLNEKAETFITAAKDSENIEQLALDLGYSFTLFEQSSRTDPVSDPATRSRVFALPYNEGEITFDAEQNADGSLRVVGLLEKLPGSASDLDETQVKGLATQLSRENSRFEGSAFENGIISTADIKIY